MPERKASLRDAVRAWGGLLLITALCFGLFYIGRHNIPSSRIQRFCIILAGVFLIGLIFISIPNCWYANCLSIMNLMCGVTAMYLMVEYSGQIPPQHPDELLRHPPVLSHTRIMLYKKELVLLLVFIGQFFDLFDGRAAEQWGSTPKGEYFDDVADGTSFGFTIGALIFVSTENRVVGLFAGATHAISTLYRLVRFIVEKHKAGQTGGVLQFDGMPSPAAALLLGSGVIVFSRFGKPGDLAIAALTALSSALQVSWTPYPHLSRAFFAWVPRRMLTLWFIAGVIGATVCTAFHRVWVPVFAVHVLVIIYAISPLIKGWPLFSSPALISVLEALWLRSKDGSRYLNKMAKQE
ncbi:CDP-alcohol phosphatidyltransferase [Carpediemonas membranifera]|uniref:CDP-alcohol phosphatidyltransferase n=1 Tax=Carpediemonas membranifera TaxID=201153 RepID=A0A8J6AVB0_9EUKA|nr:CDP-alcohol phosphatidyltransferase [Carpediemonas membranifera]|eukprot:KAG9395686.1 CDP-alcohol phosphatidyltransferase [Carpediemonas membranifera]